LTSVKGLGRGSKFFRNAFVGPL